MSNASPSRIAYIANCELQNSEPAVSFSVLNAAGFMEAGADFRLVVAGAEGLSGRELIRERFGLEHIDPVLFPARRLGGSMLPYYLAVARWLPDSGCDRVICRQINLLPYVLRAARRKQIPVYFEAHDFFTDLRLRSGPLKRNQARKSRQERRYLPRTAGIICVSEPQAKLYRAYYPRLKVISAPTGCCAPRPNTRTAFSYTLGYIGSFTEGKYPLEYVIEAMAACGREELRLIAVGGSVPEDRARIQACADRCGLGERVELHGWTSGAELEALRARMDVGLAVLSDEFLNSIASPLKVLEYLAHSKPFLASSLPGIRELVEDGVQGFLVENNAPADWARAITSMYTDFPNYQRMATSCAARAVKLSWANRARIILDALSVASRGDEKAVGV